MTRKITILTLIFAFIFPLTCQAAAVPLAKQLSGRILLQVESYGRAWYVYPKTGERYYLKNGAFGLEVLRSLGLEISQKDLGKIPVKKGDYRDAKLVNRLKGYILLPVENKTETWYLDPTTGYRSLIADEQLVRELIKKIAVGIGNKWLKKIPMNQSQLAFDFTFSDVAYVKYGGAGFSHGYFADKLLPPASLTKLTTALVLLDQISDWEKKVKITQAQIDYPIAYVGNDPSSEIDCQAGDEISLNDLWVAMLLASSNQSTVALVDATGLSPAEFVGLMNQKAKDLGLKKTIFYDVAGLDSHNITTPKEMAIIAQAAFNQSKIAQATSLVSYTIASVDSQNSPKEITVKNRNYSLLQFEPDGSKTGYLVEAQRTVALKKGNEVIVVMHASSLGQRNKIIESLLK